MSGKTSVCLIAVNRLLREALAKLLGKKEDFEVGRASAFVSDADAMLSAPGVDVLVLDANSAQQSERALVSDIRARAPNVKIVLIDMADDPETFLECVRAGVAGYFLQDASAADIIAGVRAVAQGYAACPPKMCMLLFQNVAKQQAAIPRVHLDLQFGLTRRQQQLVPLIAQGFTNKEIATHLKISEQTVKNHIHRMLRRVGASDRLEVIEITANNAMYP